MKNKKIVFYLLTALILVALFCYFNFNNHKTNVYDTSQQGYSETKGQFIPEQHTDYIFTTVQGEFNFYNEIIFLIIAIIIAFIVWRKLMKKSKI